MRLAGTVSYPSPAKVERGYVPELTTLRVIDHSRAYSVAELIELATGAVDPTREYGQARSARSKPQPELQGEWQGPRGSLPAALRRRAGSTAEAQPDRRQMVGLDPQRDGIDDRARRYRRRDPGGVCALLHRRLRRERYRRLPRSGPGEVEHARRGLDRTARAADAGRIRTAAQVGRQGAWHPGVGARRGRTDARGHDRRRTSTRRSPRSTPTMPWCWPATRPR